MWKKEDAAAHPREQQPPVSREPAASHREGAIIGRAISIKGEVTGEEDLLIQGRVDGSVNLKQHSVTVGPDGVVKASIASRVVTVEGKVEGNLSADEQVVLKSSSWVRGDISSPRVVLEDGARFRGGVDMGEVAEKAKPSGSVRAKSNRVGSKAPSPEIVNTPGENGDSLSESATEVRS
jgi:cytoskeletal protein CcmA (bactofilin family)